MVRETMRDTVILRTDGGSRGNPGIAGVGFELLGETVDQSAGAYIGEATNNVAEYRALLWGLTNALALGVRSVRVQADSQLMVRQILGEYKVKAAELKPLFEEALGLLARFDEYEITHIPRELNAEADRRANEAMDAKSVVGDFAVPLDEESEQLSFDFADSKGTSVKGIYTLTVKDHFDAAHRLYDYPGQCRNLHGHTWDVEVTVASTELDELGLVVDFKDLKEALRAVLDRYDHTYINESAPFDEMSPTAENLAREICSHVQKALPAHVKVREVAVWESPIARLGFSPTE